MEVNFFKLREALETIRNFFKNKINYTQLFDFILF